MRDTADILLDKTDDHVADEIREILASHGDAEIADLCTSGRSVRRRALPS